LVIRERRKGGMEKRSAGGAPEEIFLVDNWVLVGSLTRTGDRLAPFVPSMHRFDYDTYKLLYSFVSKLDEHRALQKPALKEWRSLLKAAGGA
jgi:hypothetical protein